MKKFLSMALAATMIMSMAAVAFAAETITGFEVKNDEFGTLGEVRFGNTIYLVPTGVKVIDQKDMKDLKVTAKWDTNGDIVESVKWEKAINPNTEKGEWVIAVALKKMPTTTGEKDVIGTITVKDSSKNFQFKDEKKEEKIEFAVTAVNRDAAGLSSSLDQTGDKDYVYKFKDKGAQEEDHEIELYAETGKFVVNTLGQGDLVIKTDVKYNKGIENVSPDVNYTYFNGNNATFNRLGDLYLNANEGEFLYKVNADGTLTKVDAKYDSDEEAFVVRTRVIGSYVISEKELDVEKVNAGVKAPEETTAPTAPVAPSNPTTGAAC